MSEAELHDRAMESLVRQRRTGALFGAWVVGSIVLVAIWGLTDYGYFWPGWAMAAGLLLAGMAGLAQDLVGPLFRASDRERPDGPALRHRASRHPALGAAIQHEGDRADRRGVELGAGLLAEPLEGAAGVGVGVELVRERAGGADDP